MKKLATNVHYFPVALGLLLLMIHIQQKQLLAEQRSIVVSLQAGLAEQKQAYAKQEQSLSGVHQSEGVDMPQVEFKALFAVLMKIDRSNICVSQLEKKTRLIKVMGQAASFDDILRLRESLQTELKNSRVSIASMGEQQAYGVVYSIKVVLPKSVYESMFRKSKKVEINEGI